MPPTTGMPRARHASAMPSIASDSCHITSGCSGLPKLRQLTSPSGRAPDARQVHHRLGHHERGAPPWVEGAPAVVAVAGERRGRGRCRRPVVGCLRRSTVASPPGPSTVLRNSWWSYWRKTHDGSSEQVEQVGAGVVRRRQVDGVRPRRADPVGRLGERAVVERRVGVERRRPGCRRAPRRRGGRGRGSDPSR